MLGLVQIPAIIRKEETERAKLELALIENVQREDLNPIEKARAYKRLVDEFSLVQREVAARVGKSREAIANTMRLLQLPEYIQIALNDGKISEGHARPLLSIASDPAEQSRLFDAILANNLTVREVERASQEIAKRQRSEKDAVDSVDPQIRLAEQELGDALGTRVAIRREKGGRGHIAITFFSDEEYRHIIDAIAHLRGEKTSQQTTVVEATQQEKPETPPSAGVESFTV